MTKHSGSIFQYCSDLAHYTVKTQPRPLTPSEAGRRKKAVKKVKVVTIKAPVNVADLQAQLKAVGIPVDLTEEEE